MQSGASYDSVGCDRCRQSACLGYQPKPCRPWTPQSLLGCQPTPARRLPSHAFGAYAGAVADLRSQLRDPIEGWAAPPALDELMAGPAPRPPPSPQQPGGALVSPKARAEAKPLSSPGAAQGTQEAVQESLTDELAELAAALKQNTLGMELRVRERGRLLDQTDTALEKSLVDVKSSHKKAKDIHRK